MTCFVVGSKDPVIPNLTPNYIVSANGGAGTFSDLINKGVPWIPVITPYLLVSNSGPYKLKENFRIATIQQINFKMVKKIVIRPSLELTETEVFDATKNYNLTQAEKLLITYKELDDMLIKIIGQKNIINLILSHLNSNQSSNMSRYILFKNKISGLFKFFFNQYLRSPLKLSLMRELKISTGMLALLYAILDQKIQPPYYLIGVGSGETGHAYGSNFNIDRTPHVQADLNVLKYLAKSNLRDKIFITDKKLNKIYEEFKS